MEGKDDIIYDLEATETEGRGRSTAEATEENSECPETPQTTENSENTVDFGNPETTDIAETADISETAEISGETDPARAEIERMVGEMGADTLLEIIRDNRNAAIRQIISEVDSTRRRDLPSGGSASVRCTSIFDLAALA